VELLFWISLLFVLYAYAGYPLFLALLRGQIEDLVPEGGDGSKPSVSVIIPVYNERGVIEAKLKNTNSLDYPAGRLEVLFVSDGSDDGTGDCIRNALDERTRLIELPDRSGKAAALNAGLAEATGEIVVFTDASIMLASDAILEIVRPFTSPAVGCVSGEDRVTSSGGEALYGRYELFLRRQESRLHSIVGASGCFYAQRRTLCRQFPEGEAPDFFSVLLTVQQGFRAVTAPRATGTMTAIAGTQGEFQRKVRTLLRGMTTLGRHAGLLNPFRHGVFSVELFSHKVLRWAVPFFLAAMLISSAALAAESPWYRLLFFLQVMFYALSLAGLAGIAPLRNALPVKVSLFFTMTNAAALAACIKYFAGVRQEIWSPSRRI
jgi:cellulose synthase/poly-beta-1,6-N-acetylglucosamine synthase-like glycosyltransferase